MQRSGTSPSRRAGHRDSPLQYLLFNLQWLHAFSATPFSRRTWENSNNSNNLNNASNLNNYLFLSIGTVEAHKIQELLVEQIAFLQQALRGTHRITAAIQRKISFVTGGTLKTSKILTRPL